MQGEGCEGLRPAWACVCVQLCYLPAGGPGASDLASCGLSFLVCKTGLETYLAVVVEVEGKWAKAEGGLSAQHVLSQAQPSKPSGDRCYVCYYDYHYVW